MATILEYLDQVKRNIKVPKAAKKDERLMLLDGEFNGDEIESGYDSLHAEPPKDIDKFLKGKTKADLIELVETSHDEGETAAEIEDCMSVIIRALEESSLAPFEKLEFAVKSLIDDEYSLFDLFSQYIESSHSAGAWDELVNILLTRLENFPIGNDKMGLSSYKRNQISDWAIIALEAGYMAPASTGL